MYLGQARRLKHKQPPAAGLRLPSLEWLQWANSRAILASVLMLPMPGTRTALVADIQDNLHHLERQHLVRQRDLALARLKTPDLPPKELQELQSHLLTVKKGLERLAKSLRSR